MSTFAPYHVTACSPLHLSNRKIVHFNYAKNAPRSEKSSTAALAATLVPTSNMELMVDDVRTYINWVLLECIYNCNVHICKCNMCTATSHAVYIYTNTCVRIKTHAHQHIHYAYASHKSRPSPASPSI